MDLIIDYLSKADYDSLSQSEKKALDKIDYSKIEHDFLKNFLINNDILNESSNEIEFVNSYDEFIEKENKLLNERQTDKVVRLKSVWELDSKTREKILMFILQKFKENNIEIDNSLILGILIDCCINSNKEFFEIIFDKYNIFNDEPKISNQINELFTQSVFSCNADFLEFLINKLEKFKIDYTYGKLAGLRFCALKCKSKDDEYYKIYQLFKKKFYENKEPFNKIINDKYKIMENENIIYQVFEQNNIFMLENLVSDNIISEDKINYFIEQFSSQCFKLKNKLDENLLNWCISKLNISKINKFLLNIFINVDLELSKKIIDVIKLKYIEHEREFSIRENSDYIVKNIPHNKENKNLLELIASFSDDYIIQETDTSIKVIILNLLERIKLGQIKEAKETKDCDCMICHEEREDYEKRISVCPIEGHNYCLDCFLSINKNECLLCQKSIDSKNVRIYVKN